MTGFGGTWTRRPVADMDRYPMFRAWSVAADSARPAVSNRGTLPSATGPVAYIDPALVEAECDEFQAAMDEIGAPGFAEPFMTAPSPGIIAAAMRNEHYDTEDAYLAALGRAFRWNTRRSSGTGSCCRSTRRTWRWNGISRFRISRFRRFLEFAERVVATINDALVNIPRDRVRIHACWGNYEAPHDCDVAMADILPAIGRASVGGWVLPIANPRHQHEYRCLKDLPLDNGQVVVAGVIDPLTNFVEHPEVVADRLENVARAIGDPTRLLAGTDCGFDTSAGRGRVAEDVVWAKLTAMAEGARIASRRLKMAGADGQKHRSDDA